MTNKPARTDDPSVSFVVPCYKLAHLLPECINSILSQSYREFEILIMDDHSPDATPEVAASFKDPRVRHIRNDPNLGHLRNYNKGIELSRGRYVWLISADDYLGNRYVLERFVALLDENPRVGYTFCPAIAVGGGTGVNMSTWVASGQRLFGNVDRIFPGHALLKRLLPRNMIASASALVRRECYERHGCFPLNMPYAGDWYLWCLFALHYDVGYFAEPMVCYREHEGSMTSRYVAEDPTSCCEEEIIIPFAIRKKAEEAGRRGISRRCLSAIAEIYARSVTTSRYGMSSSFLDLNGCEASLSTKDLDEEESRWVKARIHAHVGDEFYGRGQRAEALMAYRSALSNDWCLPKVFAKGLLLSLGRTGDLLRKCVAGIAR